MPFILTPESWFLKPALPPPTTYDLPPTFCHLPLQKAVGSKQEAVGGEQIPFILTPDS
jgi:hypothetical protein